MLKISKEVKKALKKNKPVVALETTIISHGMPYPKNIETALRVEEVIRNKGAVPATIGIINGVPTIGLSKKEIEEFGQKKNIKKVSRRDLPIVVANKDNGATTVASTMILAAQAGIEIFVTGGIGGVHRDVNETFDISADLEELSRTNVTVISSGIKAILDVPRTLEVLETKGVPVLSYKSEWIPNFYSDNSNIKAEFVINSPLEAANIIYQKRKMNLDGGVLIANPIPKEYSLDKDYIEKVILEALEAAKNKKIKGKDVTPFLLKTIADNTKGKSLEANIALILNNAALGAEIAIHLSRLRK